MTSLSWQCFVDFALAVDPGELEIDKMQRYRILNQSLKTERFPFFGIPSWPDSFTSDFSG